MKIGLVRHFKVDIENNFQMTSEDYVTWGRAYDEAGILAKKVDLRGIPWTKCYASDLLRAVLTAEAIYRGDIVQTPLLREVRSYPVFKTTYHLPHGFWSAAGRLAWFFGGASQLERRHKIIQDIEFFLDQLEKDSNEKDNILIVSHGFFMFSLRRALVKRGYKGPRFGIAQNGTLYLFEKK